MAAGGTGWAAPSTDVGILVCSRAVLFPGGQRVSEGFAFF